MRSPCRCYESENFGLIMGKTRKQAGARDGLGAPAIKDMRTAGHENTPHKKSRGPYDCRDPDQIGERWLRFAGVDLEPSGQCFKVYITAGYGHS